MSEKEVRDLIYRFLNNVRREAEKDTAHEALKEGITGPVLEKAIVATVKDMAPGSR